MISLPAALFLVFLVLKLCGVITWSWLWVTAPLWAPLLLGIAFLALLLAASTLWEPGQ